MSKIGQYILEQEEAGNCFFDEDTSCYGFTNQIECHDERQESWGIHPYDTLGRDVLQRRFRYPRPARRDEKKARRSAKRTQKMVQKKSRYGQRVLHRSALRKQRQRYVRQSVLQRGANS